MASGRTNFIVGLFVILGILATVAIVIYVGASTYFQDGQLYAAYFDESIQGLDKDSPVKYRGVSIGKVYDISIAKDAQLIQIVLRIESDWEPDGDVVAQIKSIGITGIMFVELDRRKTGDDILDLIIYDTPKYPVIKTKSSEIKQLIDGLAEVVSQLKAIDFPGISDRIKNSIDTVDATVKAADVQAISSGLKTTIHKAEIILGDKRWPKILAAVEESGGHINAMVSENRAKIGDTIDSLKAATQQADRLMTRSADTFDKVDKSIFNLEQELAATLRHLEEAARELTSLTAKSAEQPSQLLFAAPPAAKEVENYD